jgi:roadblock/LC7 domain-containing protein
MSYPYLIQGSNIVVVIGNKSHTISKTHITYNKVLEAIKASDWDSLPDIIEPKKVVLNYGAGNVSIQGETLFWKGKELNTGLSVRMIQMLQEGFPIEPMVQFMENLYQNPSKRAVTELYGFLEKGNLPITPDGHFLAYKKVRTDYTDVHSGKFNNSVGQVVEMERHDVDDNKDNTCSTGLHFCAMSYLSCFGGERTVIVKINPADVVSIPSDYNDAKGRACRYEVIGELAVDPKDAFVSPVQSTAVGSQPVYQPVYQDGPKTGDSVFKRGYTSGYTGREYLNQYRYGTKEAKDYTEGYEMGELDAETGAEERYRYVQVSNSQAWPNPA